MIILLLLVAMAPFCVHHRVITVGAVLPPVVLGFSMAAFSELEHIHSVTLAVISEARAILYFHHPDTKKGRRLNFRSGVS